MERPWKNFRRDPAIRNQPHAGTGEESLIKPTREPEVLVSRLNRRLQMVRDFIALFVSALLILLGWGRWVNEPVWYIIDGFCVAFIGLSLVNLFLLRKNVKSRAFYFGNTIYQPFPSVLLGGLLPYLFLPLVVMNVVILVTLRGRMPAEQGTTSQTQAGASAPS